MLATGKNLGGIVGWSNGVVISDCYSISNIVYMDAPGGIVDCLGGTATVPNNITNCYSVSTASGVAEGATFIGTFVGKNNQRGSDHIVKDCFYNSEIAGTTPAIGGHNNTFAGAIDDVIFGKSSAEMKLQSTFENNGTVATTLDFVNIWSIDVSKKDGYPYLKKIGTSPTGLNTIKRKEIQIFPNPANNVLNYSSESTITKVTITDLSGRMHSQFNPMTNSSKFDISKLKTGMYIVQFENNDAIKTYYKFIKAE